MEKIIVNCPSCNQSVRVPTGKHIKFTCPNCKESIEFNDSPTAETQNEEVINHEGASKWVTFLVSFFLSIPLFIIAHKTLPNWDWPFDLDRFILVVAILSTINWILQEFKGFILGGTIAIVVILSLGSLFGKYGFSDIVHDYRAFIFSIKNSPNLNSAKIIKTNRYSNADKISKAADFENSAVRNYAVTQSQHFKEYEDYFPDYRTIIQAFAIFKDVNIINKWRYVHDPKSREYFAYASETVNHFSGDCDDYSIFMGASIKSIGGTIRLIITDNHIYPEILIGNKYDLEKLNYIIKTYLFPQQSDGNMLNYHIDDKQNIWLNLDYNANYPGGPFSSKKIYDVINL